MSLLQQKQSSKRLGIHMHRLCTAMDTDVSGLPSRPRSELERSAAQAALLASLDFHTAVHGYDATVALVSYLLPEPEPPTPPPPRPPSAPRPPAAPQEPRGPLRGPAWADLSSEED